MSEFLKCDAADCDHRHAVAEVTEDMIGESCPKCGADLLTHSDFDYLVQTLRPMMKLMHALGLTSPGDENTPENVRLTVGAHNGEVSLKFPAS